MSLEVGDIIWHDKKRIYEVNKILKPGLFELCKLYDAEGDYSTLKYNCQWTKEEQSRITVIMTDEAKLYRMLFR